jgi:LPXTG-site transpeptidase (sortase) family protein
MPAAQVQVLIPLTAADLNSSSPDRSLFCSLGIGFLGLGLLLNGLAGERRIWDISANLPLRQIRYTPHMFSSRWMILAGVVLLLSGLANALHDGIRPAPSPLDIAEDTSSDLGQGFAPLDVPDAQSAQGSAPNVAGENSAVLEPTPTANPQANPDLAQTPEPSPGYIPDRIVIPAISLDAPIYPAHTRTIKYLGEIYTQWVAPNEFASGWHETSARLGMPGNTVLNGHHNVYGEVFGGLVDLKEGDLIQVYSGQTVFVYRIKLKMLLRELNEPVEVRYANARWIMPSSDERLTLVTCWPKTGNSHRLIIVAFPVTAESPAQ